MPFGEEFAACRGESNECIVIVCGRVADSADSAVSDGAFQYALCNIKALLQRSLWLFCKGAFGSFAKEPLALLQKNPTKIGLCCKRDLVFKG